MKKEKSPLNMNEDLVKDALVPSKKFKKPSKPSLGSLLEPTKATMVRRMKKEELGIEEDQEASPLQVKEKSQKPKSGFKKYSALKSKIRDNYLPNKKSPLYQQQPQPNVTIDSPNSEEELSKTKVDKGQDLPVSKMTIWDNIKHMPQEVLEEGINNLVDNDLYKHGIDTLVNGLPNRTWRKSMKDWFHNVKQNIIEAVKQKRPDIKQEWMENAGAARAGLVQFIEKREAYKQTYTDETPGNIGGSTFSKGCHKGNRRKTELTYLGVKGVNMDISEEGTMHWKMSGVDDIWTTMDLDKDMFTKDFMGMLNWGEFKKKLQNQALSNIPLNESWVEGTVNGLLQTKEGVLQWLHDDNDGESLFGKFTKAVPNFGNWDIFMPESEKFNLDVSRDVVKNGLIKQANQFYKSILSTTKATKKSVNSARDLIAKYRRK